MAAPELEVAQFRLKFRGGGLWLRATITDGWPTSNPARKRIGRGSPVWVLNVVHEEPAVLIVDEWRHMQWVTMESVEVDVP